MRTGTRLGPYEIVAAIGAGGMGEVYKARDERLARDVAIKLLAAHFTDSTEAGERFEREARAAAALQHPNICTIYDVGETADGRAFIVMELLQGETLQQRIGHGPLELPALLEIGATPRRRPSGGSCRRHRPPRHQARQHPVDLARAEDSRLRPRQS
jgi:serine/threonine protein kinase